MGLSRLQEKRFFCSRINHLLRGTHCISEDDLPAKGTRRLLCPVGAGRVSNSEIYQDDTVTSLLKGSPKINHASTQSPKQRHCRETFSFRWKGPPRRRWAFSLGFPAVLPYMYLGQGVGGRWLSSGGSGLGLQPGEGCGASSSSFLWAHSCFPSERPRGQPGPACWGCLTSERGGGGCGPRGLARLLGTRCPRPLGSPGALKSAAASL